MRTSDSFDPDDFRRHMLSRRLPRRSALRYGLALGGAAAVGTLAGCTGGSATSTGDSTGGKGAPANAPQQSAVLPTPRNQTVIIGQGAFVSYGNYNPFVPNVDYANGAGEVLKEYFFYLNVAKSADNLVPWQATGWEYNADYTRITFHLDPKVRWNDGKPFTANDVKFTIELFQKHPELLISGLVTNVTEAYQQAESVTVPDDHTVVIDLKTANTRYHYNYICADIGAFLIVPEHVWSGKNPTTFANDPPIFTGPYTLKEANRTLQYYLWEKNPHYWNKARLDPKPKYVGYITKPGEADAAAQDFKNGKYDQGGTYLETKALIKNGFTAGLITAMPDPCSRAILINCDPSKGILADNRMRWVVSLLLDRHYIATSVWQPKTTANLYPWTGYQSMKKWDIPSVAAKYPLSYDPTRAATLLDQMGATKGADGKRRYRGKELDFTIINPGPNTAPEYEVGQLLVKEFNKLGIDANVRVLSQPGVYQAAVDKGDYDLRSEWGCCSELDPYQTYQKYNSAYYTPIGKTATTGDDVRLKDGTLDSLIERLKGVSPNGSAAKAIYRDALDEWYRAMPVVPYLNTLYTHQANTLYWTGWPTNDDLYQPPNNWWGTFLFVIGNLKPSGKS
jgi:peptide/nickel transport system substrate-binding protein